MDAPRSFNFEVFTTATAGKGDRLGQCVNNFLGIANCKSRSESNPSTILPPTLHVPQLRNAIKSGSQWTGKPLSLKVIGTNAGTSMDGLDIAHMHFTQESPESPLRMRLLHAGEVGFDGDLKKRVMRLIKENQTSPEEISIVNIQLGEFAANAIIQLSEKQGFSLQKDVDIIAGQGQTIWHLPLPEMFEGNQERAHLDMAEISIIAAKTGVTSLSSFRVSDMALGRQGCPLFVAWDGLCTTHPTKNRAVQNIGGIANITMLPKGDIRQAYDFDTGPGNVFIDAAVRYFTDCKQQYDKDGKMGKAGQVDRTIVDEILAGPYLMHDIPKTTGRETFGDRTAEEICERMLAKGASPEDCVATITRITAKALADAYERWGPKGGIAEVFLGGGGSYNPNIISYLQQRMPNTRFAFLDEIGVPTGSREAMDFGFKGLECILGRSLVVPQRVESSRAGIIGHIQPGSGLSYHRLMKHVQDFLGHVFVGKEDGSNARNGNRLRHGKCDEWSHRPSLADAVGRVNGY